MTRQIDITRLVEIEDRLIKAEEIIPNQLGGNLTMDQKKFILNAISDVKFLLDELKIIEDNVSNLYNDMDTLHDAIYDLYDICFDDDHLRMIVDKLPRNIILDALKHGLSDSVVRDDIYVYLRDTPSFIEQFK